jgi:transposase
MRRAFKYRLYPTKLQAELLGLVLEGARSLYNAALGQRRTYWLGRKQSIHYAFQAAELKDARDADPRLWLLNYSACQDVLRRLEKAFWDAAFEIPRRAAPRNRRLQAAESSRGLKGLRPGCYSSSVQADAGDR